MKFVDLFCGIGSFHYSFKRHGWECVMACDINETARQTYSYNYKMTPLADIYDIDPSSIEPYDILCAGFPCQAFSRIGKRRGLEDTRGILFYQVMKFITHGQPLLVILENVPALKNHDNGATFEHICNLLKEAGYKLDWKILKCSDYGIPQGRKRLFIVATRDDSSIDLSKVLDCTSYEKECTLTDFFKMNFRRKYAYTIRCGGRLSPLNDRHNWDGYIVNDTEYRLTIQDALDLQGFERPFKLLGSVTQQWKQVGNTIPTIFTYMISNNIKCLL